MYVCILTTDFFFKYPVALCVIVTLIYYKASDEVKDANQWQCVHN